MIKRILKRLLRPNYSNGKWHSWYGGECPVAPDAWVQGYVYVESDFPMLKTSRARVFDWEHKNDPICRFRVTSSDHGYDWQAMDFDPEADSPEWSFAWDETPEGASWWDDNYDTPAGLALFAEMKRLYAADMQHRHNGEAMKQSANHMTGPED